MVLNKLRKPKTRDKKSFKDIKGEVNISHIVFTLAPELMPLGE